LKVTNNLLFGGLMIALLVVIGGTWISLNYISGLTGAATSGVGSTNVTITSAIACSIPDNLISFGEMARGQSNQSNLLMAGQTNVSAPDYMTIQNDGNVNITVVASNSVNLWSSSPAPSTNWRIRCEAAGDGNSTCTNTYANVPAAGSNVTLVSGLTPVDALDNISVGFNLTVPSDESSGAKNGTVIFTCVQTA